MKGGSHRATELPYSFSSEAELGGGDYLMQGGSILYAKASQALKLGDIVFYSALNTFNKTTTPANYAGYVAVVVGGKSTDMKIIQDDALIGVLQVAATGEDIILVDWGIAKVVSDKALTIATKLTGGSVTAGRASDTGAASGNFVGMNLDAAAGAGIVIRLAVNAVG